jgi:hypothetical protein
LSQGHSANSTNTASLVLRPGQVNNNCWPQSRGGRLGQYRKRNLDEQAAARGVGGGDGAAVDFDGGGRRSSRRVTSVVTNCASSTSAEASQNQARILRKRLRIEDHSWSGPRVNVTDTTNRLDALDAVHAMAELLAQVADVGVYAAVEWRQLTAQYGLNQLFARDDATGSARR